MRHLTLLVGGVLMAIAAAACGGSMTPNPITPTVPIYTTMPSNAEMLGEKVLGSAGAQNTIIEYVSFWCPACRDFHGTIAPQIKTQFVDTGRARLVFRNLFLVGQGETPVAAALARCVGDAKFYDAVNYIYQKQTTWLAAADPLASLQTMMLGYGMSQGLIDACAGNNDLLNGLGAVHNAAIEESFLLPDGSTVTGFTAVPAVVVNGTRLQGSDATLANIATFLK